MVGRGGDRSGLVLALAAITKQEDIWHSSKLLLPFHSVWNLDSLSAPTSHPGSSVFPSSLNLSGNAHPEVYLLGDSKSIQSAIEINHPIVLSNGTCLLATQFLFSKDCPLRPFSRLSLRCRFFFYLPLRLLQIPVTENVLHGPAVPIHIFTCNSQTH